MTQTYNDGVVKLYSVTIPPSDGKRPIETLTLKHALRYHRRTVGMNRHYVALQAQVNISHVLRCQRLTDIATQHVAILPDGEQYRIVQIQYPDDIEPPSMDLTLERLTAKYEVDDV